MSRDADPPSRHRRFAVVLAALLGLSAVSSASAGSVETLDGFYIPGEPTGRLALSKNSRPIGPVNVVTIWAIDDGMRTYYVPRTQINGDTVDHGGHGIGYETFEVPQRNISAGQSPSVVGAVPQQGPFDEFGRREVTLKSDRGGKTVIQGVTTLRPDWVGLQSLNLDWDYAISTKLRSDAELIALLDIATDREAASDRMARVKFLIQCERLGAAAIELDDAVKRFPSLAGRAEIFRKLADQSYGTLAMSELQRRQRAGQHKLVRRLADAFDPTRVAPETFGEADAIRQFYDDVVARNATICLAIEMLESQLDAEPRSQVAPLRRLLLEELTIDTIDRLDPFVDAIDDVGLTPAEKLAIAYSSFVGGEKLITYELPRAIRLWDLRAAVADTLRATDEYDLREGINTVQTLEGAAVPVVEEIVKRLPVLASVMPTFVREGDRPDASASRLTLDIESHRTETAGTLRIQKPPEYRRSQTLPLLVVLATGPDRLDSALDFWAGDDAIPGHAARNGYLTMAIAADALSDETKPADRRDLVLDAIRTLKRRFLIDSDRVFLAGHGRGGSLACELGMSRPYDWAGVISICGPVPKDVRSYGTGDIVQNLSMYQVCGELDGGTIETQARMLETMMRKGRDVVLCEYQQRGLERYPAELDRIFDWMDLQARPAIQTEWDIQITDPTHSEWDWFVATPKPELSRRKIRVSTTKTNKVIVQSGRDPATLWIDDELVNFDRRVLIQNGRKRLDAEPSVAALLEDVWRRGDRSRIFVAKVEL